ncbi:DNA-binding protein [Zhenhengia yiwuensis]|uniref:DNA-binding protein n=1 Tax=Zhenhengia yiwuensis TaxID=2763666 RepID=UPI002A759C66|nr:DNA-binding protein [Zhenhengia yiwuensis]MDY3366486.1 DNA-binding protein [Zhenhengia yiwuensis]
MNTRTIELTESIKEHRKKIERSTLTVKELAEVLGIGTTKARQLTHKDGWPVIVIAGKRLTVISGLEKWLENNIGQVI